MLGNTVLEKMQYQPHRLSLWWQDGSQDDFTCDWLRDNAPDAGYDSGQKAYSLLDIPTTSSLLDVSTEPDQLRLMFGPDNYRICFPLAALKGRSRPVISDRSECRKQLWSAADMTVLPVWSYPSFMENPETKLEALERFRLSGVFKLKDVPCESGEVLKVINAFGFVRETNYGALFDVRSRIDPANQAFTRRGLGAHTDNPYRDPVPTIQLLHCLQNTATGGDTFLLDGFRAAALLRDTNPEAFDVLTRHEVSFDYQDTETALTASVKLIETSAQGDICRVRYNNRSINTRQMTYEMQQCFYPACRAWAECLQDESLKCCFKLQPGELIVFDNTRVMHGRYPYEEKGERHLQGAYSDLDGLYSTLYTLRRQYGE
ncbi:TauD/TfdA family dioxygenase [Endozoicomonadaceae bacterium StTr2]